MARRVTSYEQLQRRRYFLMALILALVVIAVGIFIELFQDQRISKIDPKLKQLAEKLDPTLNAQIIQQVESYEYLSPEQIRSEIQQLPIIVIDREGKRTIRTTNADGEVVEATLPEQAENPAATPEADLLESQAPFQEQAILNDQTPLETEPTTDTLENSST